MAQYQLTHVKMSEPEVIENTDPRGQNNSTTRSESPSGEQRAKGELGLRLLVKPKHGSRNLDVIAIHGILEDSEPSWRSPREQSGWLENSLFKRYRRSCIYEFRYDPKPIRLDDYPAKQLDAVASQLLRELKEAREGHSLDETVPLLFLGHDIGGMIMKNALVIASRTMEYYKLYLSTKFLVSSADSSHQVNIRDILCLFHPRPSSGALTDTGASTS
ncbi:hypothetical protein B0T16DRAFT_173900 [Cercophora newfieldiana]|uniref:DUF676 domain-containing protein n=1 Tax=Cercophora newfieldiana TaxID=92897 RepID=A0AA39XYZ7_9PEZI|nr:hypothetical protein B0T16DRAFT_173900 [Cercophora newfieldiana]